MRISLMIGTGGGDGGSPVDHYVDEPPCQVTTGSGRVWSSQLQVRESFSLITRAAAPCLGSRAGPWHTPWRAAVVVGQALGLLLRVLAHPLRSELAEVPRPNQVDMKIMDDPA